MTLKNNTGTFEISNDTKTITPLDGIKYISILLTSGTGTIKGSDFIESLGGDSVAIDLTVGLPYTASNEDGVGPLTIDIDASSVAIISTSR